MSGKYKTVVIDPPWSMDTDTAPEVFKRKSGKWANIDNHVLDYGTMSLDDLVAFPINKWAAAECLLFLWVLTGKIQDGPCIAVGLDLLQKWGFTYHTTVTWAKETGLAMWSPFQSRTEHILVGYRGNFNNLIDGHYGSMPNFFKTPQLNRHSQKPAKFYQLLRAWTPEPRIDLFARRAHYGFDGWGNEYVGNATEGTLLEYMESA